MIAGSKTRRRLTDVLRLQQFHGLKEELYKWRIHVPNDTGILGFVRGLRLSARLIYAIRNDLSSSGYEVSWGHLITPDENYCSPECDIIIHSPGHVDEWNGSGRPIMHFKFIKSENAVAVISCKSFITSIDKKYVKDLKEYVKNVFLFAECCQPKEIEKFKKKACQSGYKGFWYLYTCDKKTYECTINEKEWINFLDTLNALTDKHSRRLT